MKKYLGIFIVVLIFAIIATVTMAQDSPISSLLGGDNTVFDESEEAFTNPLPGFTAEQLEDFEEGDELFEEEFVVDNGLGPVLNNVSCESCHIEDGRGRPPAFTGETETGFLIRLALDERNPDGSTFPDPIYGGQFQDVGIDTVPAEGTIQITYTEITGFFADGSPYTLYAPQYDLINLNYGDLDPHVTMSPRLANQMIGLGLLEAIPEATLLALADPNDSNQDGISGRPNYVWDAVNNGLSIGRFGWKANQPNLLQQTLGAYNGDMGITSFLNPDQPCTIYQALCFNFTFDTATEIAANTDDCDGNRRDCRDNRNERPRCRENRRNCRDGRRGNRRGDNPPPPETDVGDSSANALEISLEDAELVTFYSSSLAVPAQRNPTDAQVIQGQSLFSQANCVGCHITELQTGTHPTIPQLSNQTIHPYTDLLLHDMGAGLADNQTNFLATGQEWRTAPLWGIGLLEEVNGYAFYMHDGRARTLEEAILWHGGEAQSSRDAYINMGATEREALIAFLQSL